MKILILGGSSSRNAGGVGNMFNNLGRNLQLLPDTDVHFLLYDDVYSEEDRPYFDGLRLKTYDTIGPDNFNFSLDIHRKIELIQPDIIHVMGMWMYLSYANLRHHKRAKTPYIISPHGMLDKWQLEQSIFKNATKKLVYQLYERKNLANAGCIHALNQLEHQAIRDFGCRNPVAIIPNATDLPSLDLPPTTKERDHRPASAKKTLLFLSRIHEKKGLTNLLKAWALTHPENHDWELIIAGETADKPYWNQLLSLHKQLGIADTCTFVGGQFKEDKHHTFLRADGFILPSFSEGLPVAVLEAWSYRLPVLMTPECNLPEGYTRGAAIRIDTTPAGIASGIHSLMNHTESERQRIGQRGWELVRDEFTWRKVAEDFRATYAWMLGRTTRPEYVATELNSSRKQTDFAPSLAGSESISSTPS